MSTVVHALEVQEKSAENYFGRFIDLPTIEVNAETLPVLAARAREALLTELVRLQREGVDWPSPTDGSELKARTAAGELLMLVEVQVEDVPIRVNITMGERLLKRLDAAAQAANMTRSGFISAAVHERLGDEPEDGPLLNRLVKELGRIGGRVNRSVGPKSNLGRLIDEMDQRALDGLRDLAGRFSNAEGGGEESPEGYNAGPGEGARKSPPAP